MLHYIQEQQCGNNIHVEYFFEWKQIKNNQIKISYIHLLTKRIINKIIHKDLYIHGIDFISNLETII